MRVIDSNDEGVSVDLIAGLPRKIDIPYASWAETINEIATIARITAFTKRLPNTKVSARVRLLQGLRRCEERGNPRNPLEFGVATRGSTQQEDFCPGSSKNDGFEQENAGGLRSVSDRERVVGAQVPRAS
jgi:hypothetical protein